MLPAPGNVDEFDYAGLMKSVSTEVTPPRVAESPAHLECVHTQTVQLLTDDDEPNTVTFGRVVGIHIAEAILVDGRVDMGQLQPLGRLGYLDYVVVNDVFIMERPTWP